MEHIKCINFSAGALSHGIV